jgi:hypothetical protein
MYFPFDFNRKISFLPKGTELCNTEFERYHTRACLGWVTPIGKIVFLFIEFKLRKTRTRILTFWTLP